MEPPATDRHLSVEGFERKGLYNCLKNLNATCFPGPGTKQTLGSLVTTRLEDVESVIEEELSKEEFQPYCNLTDVDASGHPLSPKDLSNKAASRSHLWELLRSTNIADPERKAFGRVLHIRSVPPIVALQLLATLSNHFDIKRLLLFFVRDKYTGSFIRSSRVGRSVQEDHGPQSYWCFTMKYYYLYHSQPEIFEGQVSGIFHERDRDASYICRGSCVISLSLDDGGCLEGEYPEDARLPWRLLILTCNKPTDTKKLQLRNAAEAFLYAIAYEMENIHEQLHRLSARIAGLAVPGDDFLFNKQYRESLLFEDEQFTNSKTHFWALQALRTMNECITDLIRHWRNFDTASSIEVVRSHELGWLRRHYPTYEPVESIQVAREKDAQRQKIAQAETEFEKGLRARYEKIEDAIEKLTDLKARNVARQEEIVALRDGLFNASTVLEARTTVLQGRNIQLLTYISMLFLPASFVTSLFGMEAVSRPSMNIKAFAMIFGLVCGLTYVIILLMGFGVAEWILKKTLGRRSKAKANRWSQPQRKAKRQAWKIGRVRKLKRTVDTEKGE